MPLREVEDPLVFTRHGHQRPSAGVPKLLVERNIISIYKHKTTHKHQIRTSPTCNRKTSPENRPEPAGIVRSGAGGKESTAYLSRTFYRRFVRRNRRRRSSPSLSHLPSGFLNSPSPKPPTKTPSPFLQRAQHRSLIGSLSSANSKLRTTKLHHKNPLSLLFLSLTSTQTLTPSKKRWNSAWFRPFHSWAAAWTNRNEEDEGRRRKQKNK